MKSTSNTQLNYAVIGNPISHSLSPVFFKKYMNDSIEYSYSRILAQDIRGVKEIVDAFSIRGASITAPFKSDILQVATNRSLEVKILEAANTIIFDKKEIKAYNTDVPGVEKSIESKIDNFDKSVLILGAGGAAKAVVLAMKNIGFTDILIANRTKTKAEKIAEEFSIKVVGFDEIQFTNYDIIINTIPEKIEIFKNITFKDAAIILDANYKNKPLKEFVTEKNKYIDGIEWLEEQGKVAYQLMTGEVNEVIRIEESDIVEIVSKSTCISLIGPMGSWKSTVGKLLAEKLGFNFIDIDDEVEKNQGKSISDIFESNGEDYFRQLERKVLKDALKKEKVVISTGGGIIKNEYNIELLKNNSWNILLYVSPRESLERMNIEKRPMLKEGNVLEKLNKLFDERRNLYFRASDLIVNTSDSDSKTITDIIYEDYNKAFGI